MRLSHALTLVTDRADSADFKIGLDGIESGTGRLRSNATAEFDGDGIRFRKGDLLFGKLRPYLAKTWLADRGGAAVGDFLVLRPKPVAVSKFIKYLLLSDSFLDPIAAAATGAKMPRADWTTVKAHRVPLPPLDEQRAIADYLDQETAQIDALVAKQEEFIGLLRERRSGVIFQAVTRGLRAGIDLKPSPLSWVAEVPASWRVLNIRRVAEMKTGHTPSRTTPEYWEHTTIPWFTLADVWQLRDGTRTYLGETKSLISPLGLRKSAAELLPAGTVVLSRTASVGFSGIMPRPMATSQDFWNWVCGPGLIPEYLLHVFRAMRSEFNLLMIGSTHKTIYQPTAAAIRIPVPPVEEQREIVSYLGDQLPHLDTLITKAEEHIALAKERRSALITAAVTGQFDVRTARKAG